MKGGRTVIENKIYNLKDEFFPLLGISTYQYRQRKNELMEWLKDFFEYEILEGKPIKIYIKQQIGEYEQMPNKGQAIRSKEKQNDYENYVIEHLPKEFAPMSKARMTRNAVNDFGKEKYNHTNLEAVSRRYVGPAMNIHGVQTEERYWCWYKTYEQLPQEIVDEWRAILTKWKCTEKEVYAAFCAKHASKDDAEMIRVEGAFKSALSEFRCKYNDSVIFIPKWKINKPPVQ